MGKFYRIIKDHPLWETGTILTNEDNSERYKAVDSVFLREAMTGKSGSDDSWYESDSLIENQPEWFEQVFKLSGLKKLAFGSKKQAQAAAAALYEEK